MHGKPNGHYTVTTQPTYFIAVTDAKEGTIISAKFVSSPTEVAFAGTTNLEAELDDTLSFNFK
jgi:hypothetical protein